MSSTLTGYDIILHAEGGDERKLICPDDTGSTLDEEAVEPPASCRICCYVSREDVNETHIA